MTLAELERTLSRVAELKPVWSASLSPRREELPGDLDATGYTTSGEARFSIELIRRCPGYGSNTVTIVILDTQRGIVCSERYESYAEDQKAHYRILEKLITTICQRQLDAQRANEFKLDAAARREFFSK